MKTGDVLSAHSAGGGGFGDPMERDPSKVRMDVINGYISLESAEKDYGVILDADSHKIIEIKRRNNLNMRSI